MFARDRVRSRTFQQAPKEERVLLKVSNPEWPRRSRARFGASNSDAAPLRIESAQSMLMLSVALEASQRSCKHFMVALEGPAFPYREAATPCTDHAAVHELPQCLRPDRVRPILLRVIRFIEVDGRHWRLFVGSHTDELLALCCIPDGPLARPHASQAFHRHGMPIGVEVAGGAR